MVNSNTQPIVLVCAADENYAIPLAVTLRSVLLNLKNKPKIALFIIDGGISQRNKRRIFKSLDSQQVDLTWVTPDERLIQNLKVERYLTIVTYYRLLIPQIVPQHFNKAIYLDSDMVVKGDLEQLWNIDIGDNYVLAVQDDNQRFIWMSGGLRNYNELGINPNLKYFNAGMLVINLEKWRADNIPLKVVEYLERNKEYVRDHDQDGLNGVLVGKWGELHPRWNQMPRIYTYASWQDSPYDEQQYNELLHEPYIIHYTTPPKPWQQDCPHPATDLFFQYLDQTAWSGWRNTIWRRGLKRLRKEITQLLNFSKDGRKTIKISKERRHTPQVARNV
ncbi:MAG: glycosyltransferase family 8 protein [Coleofasciculus sp. Co-bin14]|nr:glycosyltransferase family 8 protein [Coleofasciculus sp. Co-bin14]